MISILNLIILAGFLAILYGYVVSKQILSASPGNAKMQEIASAIQVGARAYLKRQYKTISIGGIIILIIITYVLGVWVGLGFFIGAFLMRSSGCIINDLVDINLDSKVKRTLNRPLTSKKVSIETEKIRAISVDNLTNLSAEKVYAEIKDELKLIN